MNPTPEEIKLLSDNEWITYLKESGNYEGYDGMCDCYTCKRTRDGFEKWKHYKISHPPIDLSPLIAIGKEKQGIRSERNEESEFPPDVTATKILRSWARTVEPKTHIQEADWKTLFAMVQKGFNDVAKQPSPKWMKDAADSIAMRQKVLGRTLWQRELEQILTRHAKGKV